MHVVRLGEFAQASDPIKLGTGQEHYRDLPLDMAIVAVFIAGGDSMNNKDIYRVQFKVTPSAAATIGQYFVVNYSAVEWQQSQRPLSTWHRH
jgi:hypothetical protein